MDKFLEEKKFTLEHPNIVKVLGYCEDVKVGGIVYELMEGGDLHGLLENESKRSALTYQQRVDILAQTSEAIGFLHSKLIRHKDLKP